MQPKRILVTGASGYIAGKLVPRLLKAGYLVRCMVRDADKIAHQPWVEKVEIAIADVTQPASLSAALHQIDAAYYLIHNMSSGHGYQQIELNGAENFARAAEQAGTQHIIYLGGLADPKAKIAPHMRSRIETGITLRNQAVPVTEFRAGVIVGPGSISFEMIRFLCEQFPILVGPSWLKNRTQPISANNVIDYLIAALENDQGRGEVFEIGGHEAFTYAETMLLYGQSRGLRREMIILPTLPTAMMAYVVGKLTPVPATIAYPLIEGLNSNSTVSDPRAIEVFPEVQLDDYQQALQQSLAELHPDKLERIWIGRNQPRVSVLSEGFVIESGQVLVPQSAGEVYPKLVAWIESQLKTYQQEEMLEDRRIFLKATQHTGGPRWIEWELLSQPKGQTLVRQTGYFAPKGLGGFLSSLRWKSHQRAIFRQMRKVFGG